MPKRSREVPLAVQRSYLGNYHREIFQLYYSVKRRYGKDIAMRIARNFIDLHLADLSAESDTELDDFGDLIPP